MIATSALVTIVVSGCAGQSAEEQTGTVVSDTPSRTGSSSSSILSAASPPSPRLSPTSPPPPPPDTAPALPPFVAAATWGDSDFGVTLRVAPTPSARRAGGPGDAATAWAEVLLLAPDADTPGMREQFDCHWTWARLLEPDKPTWNLEPWRPVVPVETMLIEGCNPGGPEV